MHRAGVVHGDIATSNILFRVSERILEWSDAEVYAHAGMPETEELADASILQENVVVIDFGQSYAIVTTVINYQSPEARFEGRAGPEADIRAGFPLFDPFFGSDTDILRQSVEASGRLPHPWWGFFQEGALCLQAQQLGGALLEASKSSVRDKLRSVSTQDDSPSSDEGPMIEKSGVMLPEEVALLGDLLRRMLVYRPEDRIGMQEVIDHRYSDVLV
ncbi:kinase-like protein [Armillaria mellea]|nr:kinase-like protein [Armillaria mellea]